MSNADRIEELRTKYEENPRRYFAPLANEFRKAGDLAQAIAICREHLPKQPGHMSGYIVFGQTLFEANSLEEARSVFEQALTLDPENLIALKHLGDIARMNGENSIARRWYARVLDADPRNDDIASQLASLGAPTPAVAVPVVVREPEPVAQPVLEDAPGVFATFDPSSLLDVPDDVTPATEPAAVATPEYKYDARHEPLDLDFPDDPEPVADEEFEEGILAPEWPDTSELVARIVTPVRAATPLSSPVTVEAVAAFGRETSDPVEPVATDAPVFDGLVDAFLPADIQSQSAAGASNSFLAELEAAEFESTEFDASTFETAEFEAPLAEVEHEIPVTAQHEAEPSVEIGETPMPWDVAAEAEEQLTVEQFAVESSVFEEQTVEAAAVDLDVTAEYAVPGNWTPSDVAETPVAETQLSEAPVAETFVFESSVSDAPVADLAVDEFQAAETSVIESFATDTPVAENDGERWEIPEFVDEQLDTPVELHTFDAVAENEFEVVSEFEPHAVEELPVVEALEESFAEMSSELENERVEAQVATDAASTFVSSETAEEVVVAAAHVVPDESEKTPTFVTETMAELLVSQGFVSRAVEVYDELVRRRPHDPVLVARLHELRAIEQEELKRADELIAQHSAFETPAIATPAITPLYTTPLRATPVFTPHASTSGQFSAQFSGQLAAQQAFRTARERFAELAARRVARRTPTHATAIADDQADGLSTIFGTSQPTTTDELAARALADAFGPVQDSGESLFDPAPMPTPAVPLRALTPRHTTPVHSPVQTNPDHRSDRQPASDYSFDKFFPDPAMTGRNAQTVHSSVATGQDSSQPVNEDLAQFSAWLKGLNNA